MSQAGAGRGGFSLTPESSWQVPRPSFPTPAPHGRVCIPVPSPEPPRARPLASGPSHTLRVRGLGQGASGTPALPTQLQSPLFSRPPGVLPLTWQGDGAVLIHGLLGAGLGPPGLRRKGRPRLWAHHLFPDPCLVRSHRSEDSRAVPPCTAKAKAGDPRQEPPPLFLTDQGSPRVSLMIDRWLRVRGSAQGPTVYTGPPCKGSTPLLLGPANSHLLLGDGG